MFKKFSIFVFFFIILISSLLYAFIYWNQSPSITELSESLLHDSSNEQLSLSKQVIPDNDLPPNGTRSLFDHIIAQNNGLPFPFNNMIELLKELHPEKEAPVMLMIPDGRSLLKGQANMTFPRILLATDFQEENTPAGLGKITHGKLFLGFVDAANEIEVISYNEAAGRFEYQLVQDYCEGCTPKLVYAKRAVCLTCHQGGTPIFSQRPWNETNGQLAIAHAIQEALPGKDEYWGVPIKQTLATPERFDELTDVGNFLVVTQQVWLDGCGEQGNHCRRLLLAQALRYAEQPGQFDSNHPEALQLKQSWMTSFPEQGIKVPESDLKNRDPLGKTTSLTDWLYEHLTPDISFGEGAKDNEDLSAFEKLPPLSPSLDPLTIRKPKKIILKEDLDGVFGLSQFFSQDDLKQLGAAYHFNIEQLIAKVHSLPDQLFDAQPFSRINFMEALLEKELSYCCLDTSDMSEPQVSGLPDIEISAHPELLPYEEYCFACHRGNPAKRLNFMAGDSEQEVLANIQAKSEIRDVLDWERYLGTDKASTLMPPNDSSQYHKLQQAGEETRIKMRDTVPSLFSF